MQPSWRPGDRSVVTAAKYQSGGIKHGSIQAYHHGIVMAAWWCATWRISISIGESASSKQNNHMAP